MPGSRKPGIFLPVKGRSSRHRNPQQNSLQQRPHADFAQRLHRKPGIEEEERKVAVGQHCGAFARS
jgi:hypothetical protein